MREITKDDFITEIFEICPDCRRVFIKNKMRCFGCELNRFATVGECCKHHKIKDPDNFLNSLNNYIFANRNA
ncbi:MAG: DUF1858 domain-containing protein [Candidatus Delongbacteria bacterium]